MKGPYRENNTRLYIFNKISPIIEKKFHFVPFHIQEGQLHVKLFVCLYKRSINIHDSMYRRETCYEAFGRILSILHHPGCFKRIYMIHSDPVVLSIGN